MKKNKAMAYALAATLLVGGTFTGTKAWFSDKVTTDNGIKITMGTLDLELDETKTVEGDTLIKGWQLVRTREDTESKTGGRNGQIASSFVEIRPGDTFQRTFIVKNTGSLDQLVKVDNTASELNPEYKNLFDLTITGADNLTDGNTFRLNAGATQEVTLILTPDASKIDNKYNTKSESYEGSEDNYTFDLTKLGQITLTGRQINAEETQLSTEHQSETSGITK